MGELLKQILAKPIQLAEQVKTAANAVDEASKFKVECNAIKFETIRLEALLQRVVEGSTEYYRPVRQIMEEVEQVLDKTLSLVHKCTAQGLMNRALVIIPNVAFTKTLRQIETSTANVGWLLRYVFFFSDQRYAFQNHPSIFGRDSVISSVWIDIAALHHINSPNDRIVSAVNLLSVSMDNKENKKLIIDEGGVAPLLKLLKEGKMEEQDIAARTIASLGYDTESVEHLIDASVFMVFAKILKEGPEKLQVEIAWAVSELTAIHTKCQDLCVQYNIVRQLINHLSFETIQEYVPSAIPINKATSVLAVVMATNHSNMRKEIGNDDDDDDQVNTLPTHQQNLSVPSHRSSENWFTKIELRKMAAKALCFLVKGNSSICHRICESRALICFTVLLDEDGEVTNYSAMALMEITAAAENDADLRRSTFRPNSPSWKAIVDGLVKVFERAQRRGYSKALAFCVIAMGNLARTFRVAETRIIASLVHLLEIDDLGVQPETLATLSKFTCKENHLHLDYSKAIISTGCVEMLTQCVYFEPRDIAIPALVLMCHIARDVPCSRELESAGVPTALEWASRQAHMLEDTAILILVCDAQSSLELHNHDYFFKKYIVLV